MDTTKAWESYRTELKPALDSKVSELKLLGYKKVTEDQLWTYLLSKRWKKLGGEARLHQLVNDILSVKPQEFMSFQTVEAFKSPNLFAKIDEDELKELLAFKPGN
ncbi:hypothetical protein GCM10008967_26320 [Bacillus carboniphilus]|uniref:Post-transcriptional regulator n=1 Tax=Bacillus carboniphilus TaxID=86663 RepID=A0ABN0WE16_9BACI